MRQPKYNVNLSKEESFALREIIDNPKTSKTRRIKAELLLDLDGKRTTYEMVGCLSSIYGVSIPLIYRLMARFGKEGIESVKKAPTSTPRKPHKMTPKVEKAILSWLKTPPPQGKGKWSAYAIADKIIEEGLAQKISYQTIYRLLDKLGIKL